MAPHPSSSRSSSGGSEGKRGKAAPTDDAFSHLPAVVGPDTMTSLGVPMQALAKRIVPYGKAIDHRSNPHVGEDGHGRLAKAVFPSWDLCEVSWEDAARLARIHHRVMGLDILHRMDERGEGSSLYSRLVAASLPKELLFAVRTQDAESAWMFIDNLCAAYAVMIARQGAEALRNQIVLARTEAACLVQAAVALWPDSPLAPFLEDATACPDDGAGDIPLATHLQGIDPHSPAYPKACLDLSQHPLHESPLIAGLLDVAIPTPFFHSAHQRVEALSLRTDVCLRGAAALPAFLHPISAPITDDAMG